MDYFFPNEIWKEIDGFNGAYQVSSYGRVKTWKQHKGLPVPRMMKLHDDDRTGYYYVRLTKNGLSKKYRIHVLVAQAFIQNPNNYRVINHKDENKKNNHISNLEWCTQKYNSNYGSAQDNNKRAVAKLDEQGNILQTYSSVSEACQEVNGHTTNISKSIRQGFKAYGFHWRYMPCKYYRKGMYI